MQEESIQSKGGKARDKALTAEQKSEIAKKAIAARWANRPLKATHKGSFQKDFGIDVECYVLDDPNKTAVISQRGMGEALGLSAGGSAFPRFMATKAMQKFTGDELRQKLAQPIKFQYVSGGGEKRGEQLFNGFDATILVDLCRAIIQADDAGAFPKRASKVVSQAHVILSASAKAGIKGLVYALAGYSPTTAEVISAFKLYVQEEAKKYESEFPDELYQQWQRLYEVKMPERGKPWQFRHLTVKHIYYPLAKSGGKILELMRALKADGGKRSDKLFQFLSEVGTRALRMHMGRVLEMCESSADKRAYEIRIEDRFGNGQQELPFLVGAESTASPTSASKSAEPHLSP